MILTNSLLKLNHFNFKNTFPVVMTEKNAVKCKGFAKTNYWYLEIAVKLEEELAKRLLAKINLIEVAYAV